LHHADKEATPRKSPPSLARRLKDKLRLQFDYSWRRVRPETGSIDCRRLTDRLSDLSKLIAVHICVWEGKVRVIEKIKESRTYRELRLLPLRHSEGLLYIEVRVEVTRTPKLVTALGSEIIGWVREIGRAITWIWQPVYELRG
jgi:hypothetical protein